MAMMTSQRPRRWPAMLRRGPDDGVAAAVPGEDEDEAEAASKAEADAEAGPGGAEAEAEAGPGEAKAAAGVDDGDAAVDGDGRTGSSDSSAKTVTEPAGTGAPGTHRAEPAAVLCWVTTKKEFIGLEGGSLTVQCRYGSHYADHVKYWCHGGTRIYCAILARTDKTSSANQDKVSIVDDPAGLMFTVTMNDLKETDSGWYSCGVELALGADDIAYTEVKVFHGVSVVNSIVSGEEGSSLTVQCLYTQRLRLSEKKWCRSGDPSSCLSTGSEGSYEDTSVTISDDRTGAFTVTLKKLQMRDADWYLCSAGQQQVAVQVQVRPHGSTNFPL
ncbi:polymeric immunoglobulin receptor-like [Neolamprologus brichardi]|uniref:polymeric immunoglobulin receptor-like n=1 Tax=Neolamprologus brichardi TaxID=32507 RepID=UPI001643ADA1|nr:polymeric immunoglobulin receptor-like [Neolamprologus brichardi]